MIKKICKNEKWIDVDFEYSIQGVSILFNNKKISPEKIEIECEICHKIEIKNDIRKNTKFCKSCSKKQTNLQKYGNENYLNHEKSKQTNLKRYGSTSALHGTNQQKIDEIKKQKYGTTNNFNKIKKTNLEKYGVEYITQSDVMKESSKNTKKNRYNNPFFTNREKAKKTCINLFGKENIFSTTELIEKNRKKHFFNLFNSNRLQSLVTPIFSMSEYKTSHDKYKWICNSCKIEFEDSIENGKIPRCPLCFPKLGGVSLLEKELSDWIKSLDIEIVENTKSIISPLELDIYIPSKNIAIEFNGIYWHAELQGTDKNYHLYKTQECNKKNIKLIHVFEDEWLDKKEIIKSIIKNNLNIFDRNISIDQCSIKKITKKESEEFLNKNHIEGYEDSKLDFALFFEENIVSVLSMNRSKYKNIYWKIARFSDIINTKIEGSFKKLYNYFHSIHNESIIAFSDRRFLLEDYSPLRFLKNTDPTYWYVKNRLRHNKKIVFNYNKDSNITEWQNMQLNGYDRIWDCGRSVFTNQIIKEE